MPGLVFQPGAEIRMPASETAIEVPNQVVGVASATETRRSSWIYWAEAEQTVIPTAR